METNQASLIVGGEILVKEGAEAAPYSPLAQFETVAVMHQQVSDLAKSIEILKFEVEKL